MKGYTVVSSTHYGSWAQSGQDIILRTLRFRKRITTAQSVELIGKHGPTTLLALEKKGRIRRVKRGLYAEV
jgi:predicted transcriptional regulator of viral defense system